MSPVHVERPSRWRQLIKETCLSKANYFLGKSNAGSLVAFPLLCFGGSWAGGVKAPEDSTGHPA